MARQQIADRAKVQESLCVCPPLRPDASSHRLVGKILESVKLLAAIDNVRPSALSRVPFGTAHRRSQHPHGFDPQKRRDRFKPHRFLAAASDVVAAASVLAYQPGDRGAQERSASACILA